MEADIVCFEKHVNTKECITKKCEINQNELKG